jgi:hypothetical protein
VNGNTDIGRKVPLKDDGSFTFTFQGTQDVKINGQPGATDKYTYTVAGKFKKDSKGRDVAKGTFSEHDDIYDQPNHLYGSCETTGVTWKATRVKKKKKRA